MKVLIIDDDQDIRLIVRFAMTKEGEVEVVEAASGAEGVRKAEEEKPDVILMDMKMSSMDGSAALALLRQNAVTAGIPVIFLTAIRNPQQSAHLKKLGAAGILAKPFDPVTLADQVQAILNKK
jgi:two-component system OmpR family response regulator